MKSSPATVACAFQLLRIRLVRLADRLAYGDQAVPYLALATLDPGKGGPFDVIEADERLTFVGGADADVLHAGRRGGCSFAELLHQGQPVELLRMLRDPPLVSRMMLMPPTRSCLPVAGMPNVAPLCVPS